MQCNLVNDQEQVAQLVLGCLQHLQCVRGFVRGVLSQGVFGQFQRSEAPWHIRHAPAHVLVAFAWLSVRCCGVRVLSSISPPSSPYSVEQEPLLNSFSIELAVQCDGYLIWGLGWQAGLVAGLRVGQAYGLFHRPGFGFLVSVPGSLSTQPPFATQALTVEIQVSNTTVYR